MHCDPDGRQEIQHCQVAETNPPPAGLTADAGAVFDTVVYKVHHTRAFGLNPTGPISLAISLATTRRNAPSANWPMPILRFLAFLRSKECKSWSTAIIFFVSGMIINEIGRAHV